MPDGKTHRFTISVNDFDKSLLPANARTPGTDEFAHEVSHLLRSEYESFGGTARIVVSDTEIQVSWTEGTNDPFSQALDSLRAGDYQSGVKKLRALLRQTPDDSDILYNLGLALSDLGELEQAILLLKQAEQIDPQHVNAIVGLGVAQQRQKQTQEAIRTLGRAIALDVDNPWAHRNLGACLLSAGDAEKAKIHLEKSTALSPEDQQAWFGLGQANEQLGDPATADQCFAKVITIDPDSQIAELAKNKRSAIGQVEMRAKVGGGVRPDALMYCLGALQHFSKMPRDKIQQCAFEIAMRGQSGFDFNDSTPKYTFKTLDGEFSGLHALAYMYVGFKYVAPDADIGFDLSKEYEAAKAMFAGDAP